MEKRILLLEDEIIVALDLQEILEAAGYHTVVTHNYLDAIEATKKFKPQLAICDINLGNSNSGIEFAMEAKLILPKLEVIYVTAFSDQKMVESADATQPFNYIVKPWNEEQIKVSVNMAFKYLMEIMKKDNLIQSLSMSEYKILNLIAKQKKSKEIADMLFIAEKTVRNHRYNIIKKLNLPNDNNSLLKWAITHFSK
jgi:DNA-binding NarL/FixJ family response regulator